MIRLSVLIARALVAIGVDLACLCDHPRSSHDFDSLTPKGFCQYGDYMSGCDCQIYEPRGLRSADVARHRNGVPNVQ